MSSGDGRLQRAGLGRRAALFKLPEEAGVILDRRIDNGVGGFAAVGGCDLANVWRSWPGFLVEKIIIEGVEDA